MYKKRDARAKLPVLLLSKPCFFGIVVVVAVIVA